MQVTSPSEGEQPVRLYRVSGVPGPFLVAEHDITDDYEQDEDEDGGPIAPHRASQEAGGKYSSDLRLLSRL